MHIKSMLLAILVIAIWGVNFVVIKVGVTEIPPLAFLAIRYTLTGLLFLPLLKWPGWTQAKWAIIQGLFLGLLHQGTSFMALAEMPAGLSSVLMQSNVILVTLMGWFWFKETIGWRTWLGIFIGLSGVVVLVGFPEGDISTRGLILTTISIFFLSFTYMIMKKIGPIFAPTYIVLMSLPIAPFIILSSLAIEGTSWIVPSEINWGLIIPVMMYQVIFMASSHMIWQNLMTKEPMSLLMPLTLLVPIFGIATAMIFLNEPLTLSIFIGGGLTILGVAIVNFRKLKKKQPINSETCN